MTVNEKFLSEKKKNWADEKFLIDVKWRCSVNMDDVVSQNKKEMLHVYCWHAGSCIFLRTGGLGQDT